MSAGVKERMVSTTQVGGRARILQVARAAFVERGYAAVSMQEIADAANLTKAAIYYHFRDKQELFEAVVVGEMERLAQGLAEQLAAGPPLRAQLERVAALALGTDRGDRTRLIEEAHRYCAEERILGIHERIKATFGLLRDALVAAQERGEIGDCNIDLVLALYISMVESQIKRSGIGMAVDMSPNELARAIVSVLMDGIAAPAPGEA